MYVRTLVSEIPFIWYFDRIVEIGRVALVSFFLSRFIWQQEVCEIDPEMF